jgi:glyoxylase-like metal-dependent hydrolase (beta-lactamase superfamily II)
MGQLASVVAWASRNGEPELLCVEPPGARKGWEGMHRLPGAQPQPPSEGARAAALEGMLLDAGLLWAEGAGLLEDRAKHALRDALQRDRGEGRCLLRQWGLRWRTEDLEPVQVRPVPGDYGSGPATVELLALQLGEPPPVRAPARWIPLAEARRRWSSGALLAAPGLDAVLRASVGGGDGPPQRPPPSPELCEPVRGIRVLPVRTPTLPPATHTNAYLVGEGDLLLVEPACPDPDETRRFAEHVRSLSRQGLRPRALFATHHHPDHVGAAAALRQQLELPLWAHAATAERLRDVAEVDATVDDGERIHLDGPDGGHDLEAVHTPGHAPGHLCLWDRGSGAVIAGDMVAGVGTIVVEPEDGDMALYLDSLRRLAAGGASVLLPAHGGPIRDAEQRLSFYIAHRLQRERRVLEALRQREGPARPADLVPSAYDDVPREAWPLAERSLEAHLRKLVQDGMALEVEGGWRVVPG